MEPLKKQRELFKKTKELRELNLHGVEFQIAKRIREEEQKAYEQWLFYKKLRNEMEKGKENE